MSGVLVTTVVAAGDATTAGSVAILGSPFTGLMSALAPTLSQSSVEGLGLVGSRTGVTAELVVRLRDLYGNPSVQVCPLPTCVLSVGRIYTALDEPASPGFGSRVSFEVGLTRGAGPVGSSQSTRELHTGSRSHTDKRASWH